MKILVKLWQTIFLLTLLSMVLRLFGVTDWEPIWVLSPLWIGTSLFMPAAVAIPASVWKAAAQSEDSDDEPEPFKETKTSEIVENQIFAMNARLYVLLKKTDKAWTLSDAITGDVFDLNPEYLQETLDVYRA